MRSNSLRSRLKGVLYVACATLLGVLVTTIIHGVVELGVIALLVSDFDTYGLGFSWETWYLLHHILSLLLMVIGIIGGYVAGVLSYRYIYEQHHSGLVHYLRTQSKKR